MEDNNVLTELSSSSFLHINFLQEEDIGLYYCLIKTEYGESKALFELTFNTSKHKPSETKNLLRFVFLELDLRPTGQVIVRCESGTIVVS